MIGYVSEIYLYLSLLRTSSMNKAGIIAVIALLVLLAACGNKQMQAQPLKTQNTAVVESPAELQPQQSEPQPTKTAAEALKELEQRQILPVTTGAKQGSTGMPAAPAGVTGEDALRARTRSLYSQGTGVNQITGGVVAEFPDYTKKSSLPDGYGDSDSAGE